MNQQNARNIGYEDGKAFIAGFKKTVADPFFTDAHKAVVLSNARNRAKYTYRVQSSHTSDLYVLGANEAWDSCQQEQEEAQLRAAVEHNPNTRFCTCAACRE